MMPGTMTTPTGSGGLLRSFAHAFAGLRTFLATQRNARIHAVAAAGAVALGVLADLTRPEWCAIVLAIALVLATEALNTALEFLADAASPDFHPLVKKAKDVAAAAVLIAAAAAVVVGVLIFRPHLPW
jgi:diacylglycerol kinase (ATP)